MSFPPAAHSEKVSQTKNPSKRISKHASRIAAVQVIYQLDMIGGESEKVLLNFLNHYADTEDMLQGLSKKFLRRLVSHYSNQVDFDKLISDQLTKNGSISMMPPLAKSIIKVAVLEMMFEKTDMPVIINEYVNIAKYFLERNTISFINAILDKISKNIERKEICQENK